MHSVAPPPKDPLTEPGPWNAIAHGYDDVTFGQLPELTDAAIELLAPEHEDTVLDVAAGPGTLAVRLAPRVRRVIAIDFAEVMIERLRGHIMRSRLANLEAKLMNGQELELENDSFDSAVSLFGVYLFDDRAQGLGEMFRVIVPGGKVVTSSWAIPERNTMLGVGMAALRAAVPDLSESRGLLPTQDPELCAAELEAAGFEQVATELFKKTLSYASVNEYWQSFERSAAPLVVLRKELGPEGYAAAVERTKLALLATCGEGSFNLDCAAILTFGERPPSAA